MRVLRVLTRANIGGPTRQALDLFHLDPAVGLQTLLVVGRCGTGETEFPLPQPLPNTSITPASRGVVRVTRMGRAPHLAGALATRELRELIRAFRPDIVHTHTSHAGLFGRRAAWKEGVPVAHTFHGHVLEGYYPRPMSRLMKWAEARMARHTDLLFAVSRSCREELASYGIGEDRIEVLPPAVDLAPFASGHRRAARAALGLQDSDFSVAFVGRLVPVKRPEWFPLILDGVPDARGVVFGDGPAREAVQGHARIAWLGATDRLPERLAAFDALVLTSQREGLPLVALEAAAAGVPVIGCDVPGIRDALRDGRGILVPEAEGPPGLARAVRGLKANPAWREDIVRASRARLEEHAPERIARRLAARYLEVCSCQVAR